MTRRTLLTFAAVLAVTGCERTFRDMYDQPRYKPLAPSALWADGRASRSAPDGVIAHSEGTVAGATSGRRGVVQPAPQVDLLESVRPELRARAPDQPADTIKAPITLQALARGRERFDIFCSPCHSIAGDGDGMVARRGFPHPPSFHIDRLRNASDAHFYAVMTYGYGAMHSYATRVPPADRLAIIGYIRALQLSQHVPAASLQAADMDRLLVPRSPSTGGGRSR